MLPIRHDINMVINNSITLKIEFESAIENINDIYFTAKDNVGKIITQKSLNNGITRDGQDIVVRLKPNDTDNLVDGYIYNYDVVVKYNANTDRQTIVYGSLKIKKLTTMPSDEV